MPTLAEGALACLFVGAIAFVFVSQIGSLVDSVNASNPIRKRLKNLPDWRVFAPKPVTGRRHILRFDSSRSTWSHAWSTRHSPGWRLIWHPGRRSAAILYQLEASLTTAVLSGDEFSSTLQYREAEALLRRIIAHTLNDGREGMHSEVIALSTSVSINQDADQAYRIVVAMPVQSD